MLPDVVIGAVLLVDPSKTFEARVWHVLLIKTPGDTLVLEQVNDGRNILRNGGEWVAIEPKVLALKGSVTVK